MNDEKNKVEGGVLYLVCTPIGNLSDISERAIKVLSEVDFIAAEDTRNSAKLLLCLGIKGELVSYHEHNKRSSGERIIARLLSGESCALVTDAGMPAISDPGEDVVALAAEAGVRVSVVPGPCAAVSALAMSGLSTSRFVFEGFLPVKSKDRRERLQTLLHEQRTAILYEAPHKLIATLLDLCEALGGERRISLCRELTKINEEVLHLTLAEAAEYYKEREPRGEYVLILEGASIPVSSEDFSALSPEEHVKKYTDEGLSRKDAIKAAARDRGMSKSDFYKLVAND
ncbi:MAG: 16S rRNA (cytidine(1402)-2'-O)-methyltransferase [Clostridia bacterium]|nr:16S rRNA (cytidine(1402)-2'-O)-methyltransferase [Clostridia bacterium]